MSQLPHIHLIYAADAPLVLAKFVSLLQNWLEENRISSFDALHVTHGTESDISKIRQGDIILVLLSNGLLSLLPEIEKNILPKLDSVRVVGVKVDNVSLQKADIILPLDLKAIRNSDKPEKVWKDIRETLIRLVPKNTEEEGGQTKKQNPIFIIVGVLILGIGIFLLYKHFFSSQNGDSGIPIEEIIEIIDDIDDETEVVTPIIGLPGEDCLGFDTSEIISRPDADGFLVTDGRSRMMRFRDRDAAEKAVQIIRHYSLSQQCFAMRPNPGLRYFKVNQDLPSGDFPGEDCIRILHNDLTIRSTGDTLFQVVDSRSLLFAGKSREEAERIIEIVQHYKARFICFVGRPNPGMAYLKK